MRLHMLRTRIDSDFYDDRLLSGKLSRRQLERRLRRRQMKRERPWR